MLDQDKTAGRGLPTWTELAEQAKTDGFTRAIPSGALPTSGYMVALEGHEEVWPVDLFCAAALSGYVARKFDVLTGPGEVYLGAWLSNGLVYLDVSENTPSLVEAVTLGAERKQLAVWDVVNSVEVAVVGAHA